MRSDGIVPYYIEVAIMKDILDNSAFAAKQYGLGYDLVVGANIEGFIKVTDAMMVQGLI